MDCSAPDWFNKIPIFIIWNIKFLIFDDFWISGALEARIYSFYYTKMLQKIQEKLWTSWEHIIFVNMDITIFENIEGMCTNFIFEDIISKLYFTKMRIGKWLFSIHEAHKNLEMNFTSIKNMKRKLPSMFSFSRKVH